MTRYLYVKDLCSEDEGEFKITKKSLNLSAIRSREAGKSTLICELIYFGNAWWQCGMLLENKYNQKMAEYVDDLTKQKEKTNEKAAFPDFIKASGGKSFVFCQSQEEISDFLLNKMGLQFERRPGHTTHTYGNRSHADGQPAHRPTYPIQAVRMHQISGQPQL